MRVRRLQTSIGPVECRIQELNGPFFIPDCVVQEVGLARNISLLRQALGSDGEAYIETVPRRGYRFMAGEDKATGHLPAVKRRRILPLVAGVGALLLAAFSSTSPHDSLPPRGSGLFWR